MSLHRRNPKRDASEAAIIRDLKKCGCSVQQLSGKHVPDLLVGYCGENYLLEVKSDKGRPTAGQNVFAEEWRGKPPCFVHTTEEALRAIGAIR